MRTRHRYLPADRVLPNWQILTTTTDTLAGTIPRPKGGIRVAWCGTRTAGMPSGRGDFLAQVGRSNSVVGQQFGARAVQHQLARFEHVATVGQPQRLRRVLLH